MQTHSQTKANKFLHSNRNSANGLLLVPNTWNQYGYTIKDTIELIEIPFINVQFKKTDSIFKNNVYDKDIIKSFSYAFQKLYKIISQ